jgi:ATP-dependent DNA ligase
MIPDAAAFPVHERVTDVETHRPARPDRALTRRLMSIRPQPSAVVPVRYAATTGSYARVHSPYFYGLRTHTVTEDQEVCGEVQV